MLIYLIFSAKINYSYPSEVSTGKTFSNIPLQALLKYASNPA